MKWDSFHGHSIWIPYGIGDLVEFGNYKNIFIYFTDTTHYRNGRRPEM